MRRKAAVRRVRGSDGGLSVRVESWPPGLIDEYLQMRERERKRHFASTGDVAEWLGVSPSTVRNWCEAGWLPHVRIGER